MEMDWRVRLEPAITPIFRAWWRLSRGATLGVRGVATDEAGHVLLIRHTYSAGWHLPGGGVEAGETTVSALRREMAEEGGIAIEGPPLLIGLYANHAAFKNDHVAVYRIDLWRTCPPLGNGEIAERGFFARDQLPDGVTQGTRRRLAEVFDGAPVAPEW